MESNCWVISSGVSTSTMIGREVWRASIFMTGCKSKTTNCSLYFGGGDTKKSEKAVSMFIHGLCKHKRCVIPNEYVFACNQLTNSVILVIAWMLGSWDIYTRQTHLFRLASGLFDTFLIKQDWPILTYHYSWLLVWNESLHPFPTPITPLPLQVALLWNTFCETHVPLPCKFLQIL